MARIPLPFIVAVAVFFFSFTLSHARIPANVPGDEVIGGELASSLPESAVNPVIRLPGDAESHSNEPARETQESEPVTLQAVPLKLARFIPVDRRFRIRSRFPVRCRHHHHHRRIFMPMRQHMELPYGDDMVLRSGENGDFDPGMFHRSVRRIPARWVKFYHHHHHDDDDEYENDGIPKMMFKHSDVFDKEKFKNHKHHHHHDKDEEEDKENRFNEHKESKKEGGGFMQRIRKMLDHF